MKQYVVALFFSFIFIFPAFSQNTIIATGNWNNPSIWSGNDVANDISEDVFYDPGPGFTATVTNGFTYTIGNIVLDNNAGLIIRSGGRLNVGSPAENKTFTANNNGFVNIEGDLYVYGDFNVNNNLTLFVSGNFIVTGSINVNNNASFGVEATGNIEVGGDFIGNNNTQLDVDAGGTVSIGGSFVGGNNTLVNVDGLVEIDGDITVGNHSRLDGNGQIIIGGNCYGPVTFCQNVVLPIELISFTAKTEGKNVRLNWATASEENFDYFTLERSTDAVNYEVVEKLTGNGWSDRIINYTYTDHFPLAGRSYYRLKATDFDGYFEYFQPVMINSSNLNKELVIASNPVSQQQAVSFRLNFTPEEELNVQILDISGTNVFAGSFNPGLSLYELGENLQSGLYILKVETSSNIYSTRFIKK